jgi:predicted aminopeptidase
VRRAAVSRAALGAVLAAGLAGCATPAYLARLGWTEARILLAREPIRTVLARPDLAPELRERLDLVLAVRAWARDGLGLRVGDSYATYADVGGAATVWVVAAARRDRLEAHTWWYPIVGRVPYRGFFSRPAADAEARALAGRDLDVDVREAVAFSTLGWFSDPLLATTAEAPPVALAETVIHELFHATLYLPGEAVFNESAATFVGHRGAIGFFCGGPGDEAERCARARRRWRAVRALGAVLEHYAARLRRLYARNPLPAVRARARERLAAAAARALARRGFEGGGGLLPPNNARLLGELAYTTDLDVFQRLAPEGADLRPALAALVRQVRHASDPFAAARRLATRTDRR